MAQARVVGRKIVGKIALIVAGAATDGTFEEPFADTIFSATAHLANLPQQGRNMDGIANPLRKRGAAQLLNGIHTNTLSPRG